MKKWAPNVGKRLVGKLPWCTTTVIKCKGYYLYRYESTLEYPSSFAMWIRIPVLALPCFLRQMLQLHLPRHGGQRQFCKNQGKYIVNSYNW